MDSTLARWPASGFEALRVRTVAPSRPFVWLRRGFDDLAWCGPVSLGYGALVAAFGVLLLAVAWDTAYLVPALTGGFLLVAPFVAIVFYALSRQRERQLRPDAVAACFAWRSNTGSIALFGLMLALALIFWERLAAIVFALSSDAAVPVPQRFGDALGSAGFLVPFIALMVVGLLVAAVVFALSVVTAPLLLDRPVDVVTAALTSLRCCLRNPGAALVWAALIAAWTVLGCLALMLGLAVVFPWLGHASWHAYRDLVEPAGPL